MPEQTTLLAAPAAPIGRWRYYLPGQLTGGKNRVGINHKTGQRFPHKHFAEWRDRMLHALSQQNLPLKPINVPCTLTVWYQKSDLRIRDTTALLDGLYHLLERAEVIANDFLFQRVVWVPVEGAVAGAWIEVEEAIYPVGAPWLPPALRLLPVPPPAPRRKKVKG